MLKLTRLNNHVVAINPDHITWVDAAPDTTLFLMNGEKILVRESLDELIAAVIDFRRQVRSGEAHDLSIGGIEGDPPRVGMQSRRPSDVPRRTTSIAPWLRGER